MSRSCFQGSGLRGPTLEGTPSRERRGDHGWPGGHEAAVPGPQEKVLPPGRDWDSGRGVRERPEPALGGEGALGVSCVVEKERPPWWSCPRAGVCSCRTHRGLRPRPAVGVSPPNSISFVHCPAQQTRIIAGLEHLPLPALTSHNLCPFAKPPSRPDWGEPSASSGPSSWGRHGVGPVTSESGLSESSSPEGDALRAGLERNQLNQPKPEPWGRKVRWPVGAVLPRDLSSPRCDGSETGGNMANAPTAQSAGKRRPVPPPVCPLPSTFPFCAVCADF